MVITTVPAIVQGQSFAGEVVEDVTGRRLAAIAVMLLDSAGHAIAYAESDSAGTFRLRLPGLGRYRLHAQAPTYEALTSDLIEAPPDDTLEVQLRLQPRPALLEELAITAERRHRQLVARGFYDRRGRGQGFFLDRDQILDQRGRRVTDLLRQLPGIQVRASVSGGNIVTSRRYGFHCPVKIVLDNLAIQQGSEDVDNFAVPAEVIGIEYYPTGVGAPLMHVGTGTRCGILMIWTN